MFAYVNSEGTTLGTHLVDQHDSCPMCRRLLLQPRVDAAEPDHQINPDTQIDQLGQQFIQPMDLSFILQGPFNTGNHRDIHISLTQDNDVVDRTEFSGMYS